MKNKDVYFSINDNENTQQWEEDFVTIELLYAIFINMI